MKYWRGYLTAGILLACTWALREFAKAHTELVDMIYPYVTRMAQIFLSGWSSAVDFCVWQMLLLALITLIVASGVLVIILKWNPIRWGGWVCAVVAAVVLLNTGLYRLNEFSGPLSEDIRLKETDYNIVELENAAVYYRDQVNVLADQIQRDEDGNVMFSDFQTMAAQAAKGFEALVYEESLSVFAGPTDPVKKLGWEGRYTAKGITGVTVGLTGEAAVNTQTPAVMMPFAMCREMARRASIAIERDAAFAACLACRKNTDSQFQYSGLLMSYRYCLKALEELDQVTGDGIAARVSAGETASVARDLAVCDEFFGDNLQKDAKACDLLVSWHIQEVVLPSQIEEEVGFDPLFKNPSNSVEYPYG